MSIIVRTGTIGQRESGRKIIDQKHKANRDRASVKIFNVRGFGQLNFSVRFS